MCGPCKVRWPLGFVDCPTCGAKTKVLIGMRPDKTEQEALAANKQREFDRIYADREQKRIARGELAPEELGKRQAQEVIQLERLLTD